MIAATPIKLRNGDWGARAQTQSAREGDTLNITTKAGKSWTAIVVRVVWKGDGVSICSTKKMGAYQAAYSREYCGYPCPVNGHVCSPTNGPCHDCE